MATRRSPDSATRGDRGRRDLQRAGACEHRRAENTLDHGLIVISAVIVHMGLSPPEVGSADASQARA